jgi:hypothetical protein
VYYGSRVGQEPRSSLVEEGERIEPPFGQALLRSGVGGAFLLTLHELQDISSIATWVERSKRSRSFRVVVARRRGD